MNTFELAIKHGDYSVEHGINGVQFTNKELQAFAQAVIENYKASLIPVAHINIAKRKVILDDTLVFKTPTIAVMDDVQLYTLPSGEAK